MKVYNQSSKQTTTKPPDFQLKVNGGLFYSTILHGKNRILHALWRMILIGAL